MRPHYTITKQPAEEPITYAELASHLRVDSDADTDYVTALISVAREWVDKVTGRAAIETDYLYTADSWETAAGLNYPEGYEMRTTVTSPVNINLYRTPLVAVRSVKYFAPGSTALTELSTDDYRVVTGTEPGAISIYRNLPALEDRPDAIQIAFTAGHAETSEISAMHKHAVKLMATVLYENSMPIAPVDMKEIPYTLQAIIGQIKVGGWAA
jgi:uncharacterized phiE125 gp8 family phage protein